MYFRVLYFCVCVSFISPVSYILFAFSSSGFPEPWREGFDGDIIIIFQVEYFKVSYSLPNVWLWEFEFVPICCQKKTSLSFGKQGTDT